MKLLGIHWGQFPERWELARGVPSKEEADPTKAELIVDRQYVKGLSGMTCVVPSWDILATLRTPKLVEHRARVEAELRL